MERLQLATFAGGCFWCTEAIYKRLKGVELAVSGYAGGISENPNYEQVISGSTGHAEAVQISFDPFVIPYEKLLDIFWNMVDPTTLNQQGNDIGSQYRSVIFYHDSMQKELAEKSKTSVENSNLYRGLIVTEIVPYVNFYKAEDYHQDYYENYQNQGYCRLVINPKISKLLKQYEKNIKDEYLM